MAVPAMSNVMLKACRRVGAMSISSAGHASHADTVWPLKQVRFQRRMPVPQPQEAILLAATSARLVVMINAHWNAARRWVGRCMANPTMAATSSGSTRAASPRWVMRDQFTWGCGSGRWVG